MWNAEQRPDIRPKKSAVTGSIQPDAPYSVLRVPYSAFHHLLFAISYFLVTRPYGG
jgi:hypothetical protein